MACPARGTRRSDRCAARPRSPHEHHDRGVGPDLPVHIADDAGLAQAGDEAVGLLWQTLAVYQRRVLVLVFDDGRHDGHQVPVHDESARAAALLRVCSFSNGTSGAPQRL